MGKDPDRRQSRRDGPVAAALAVALLALPASAAAAPTLAGTNVLTATTSGFVPVRLPTAVDVRQKVPYGPLPGWDIEGGGRVSAVYLMAAPPPDGKGGFEARHPEKRQGKPSVVLFRYGPGEKDLSGVSGRLLPAGDYWLYAFTDGAPIRATLRLPGLSGERSLAPTVPVQTRISSKEIRNGEVAPGVYMGVWGDEGAVVGDGLLYSRLDYDQPRGAGPVFVPGLCYYHGGVDKSSPLAAYAFYPKCPGGRYLNGHDNTFVAAGAPTLTQTRLGNQFIGHTPGVFGQDLTVGLGWNRTQTGLPGSAPQKVKFVAAWLSLHPAPGTPIIDPEPETTTPDVSKPPGKQRARSKPRPKTRRKPTRRRCKQSRGKRRPARACGKNPRRARP